MTSTIIHMQKFNPLFFFCRPVSVSRITYSMAMTKKKQKKKMKKDVGGR